MIKDVLVTEDIKRKHVVDIRARDGMPKHLRNILTHQIDGLMVVWNTIIAEIQMVMIQFGALQLMHLKNMSIVTQCMKRRRTR